MPREAKINISVNSNKSVASISKLKEAFQQLNEEISKHGKNGNLDIKVNVDIPNLNVIKDVAKAFNEVENKVKKLNKAIDEANEKNNIFNINQNITRDFVLHKGGDVAKQYTRHINNVAQSFEGLSAGAVNALNTLKKFNQWMVSSFMNYADLTTATYNLGIAGQMTLSEIDKLNDSFLSLSNNVSSSAQELAEAVNALIRTGRSYEDSRKIIEEVSMLSIASGENLKETAGMVTKAMVSLNIQGDHAKEALNTLHSVAIQTASDMKYLANSFKSVAGTASIMVNASGLSGEALENYKQKVFATNMAMIGALANTGVSASY